MMSTASETRPFQTEIRKLLDILVHSLYTDREIFLRELISNASDALHRLQFEMLTNHAVRDPEIELAIRISGDPKARTLTIADTGIGMTREELIDHLGTIARSGAEAFMRSLEAGQRAEQIGQFGVGFYSLFMVATEVRVTSLSYRPDADGLDLDQRRGGQLPAGTGRGDDARHDDRPSISRRMQPNLPNAAA